MNKVTETGSMNYKCHNCGYFREVVIPCNTCGEIEVSCPFCGETMHKLWE